MIDFPKLDGVRNAKVEGSIPFRSTMIFKGFFLPRAQLLCATDCATPRSISARPDWRLP